MRVSPKVYTPATVQLVVGLALVLAGHDDTGLTLIAAAAGTGALGYQAPAEPRRRA